MWLRTVDGELVNLDKCEAITVEEESKYFEVIAIIPSGRVVVASNFSSNAEASQYIKDKVSSLLGAVRLV